MSYVIYNKETTKIVKDYSYGSSRKEYYTTEAAAKAAVTRFAKKGMINKDEVAVTDHATYANTIEAQVKRVNMMSGKEYYESVNTPSYCSPSSESYWSM
jgi:hypothetical protein